MDAHHTDTTPLDPGSPQGRGVARRPDPGIERRLWFSILGPAAAWTVVELAGISVMGRACGPSGLTGRLDTWQWVAVFAIPVAGAAIALTGLLVALGVFRRWSGPVPITRAEGWNRVEFMAIGGAIISLFLLINIVYFTVMPLIVDPCMRAT